MKEIENTLNEFESLLGKEDEQSKARKEEILSWLESNATPEVREKAKELIQKNLRKIDHEILTIRQQMGDIYDLLPLSYIASHYFGKSAAWLYQRLNGHPVRGKVYTLNEEQRAIFNQALQDLSKIIGSFRI